MPSMAASKRPRLVAVASHPIQYHAPLYRALARSAEIDLVTLFVDIPDAKAQGEGFGIEFQWDVPLLDGYRSQKARTRRLSGAGFLQWRVLDAVGQLRELQPDAVLIPGWQNLALLQFWRAARRLGVPVLVRGESSALKQRRRAIGWAHRALLRRGDAFLAIGSANRAFYRGNGVPEGRIFDAPYFVDNGFFAARADAARMCRASLRARFGVPVDATCFLFVGKLQGKKHPAHVLDAVARLKSSSAQSNAFLLVIGTGELEESLRARAADLGAPVAFAGFLNQSRIPEAYAAADALVLPSDAGETWGLVVNEAMACGVPAIVSDLVGCGPDLVESGVTGERYRFGDIDALVSIMRDWYDEPAAREALGRAARARVFANHTVERSARAIVDATLGVIARSRPGLAARDAVNGAVS